MEEVHSSPHNVELKPSHSAAPEQVGDFLLRFEIPNGEHIPSNPKLPIEYDPAAKPSHEKLRHKIQRYKEQKLGRSKESPQNILQPPELTEAQFDKRREAMGGSSPVLIEPSAKPTIIATSDPASAPMPMSPPPLMPPPLNTSVTPVVSTPVTTTPPVQSYKKPVLFGLIAGVITATIVIALYFTK